MTDPLEISPYDPDWAVEFEKERARLQAALDALAVRIEHHGSTFGPRVGGEACHRHGAKESSGWGR